jgi:hypothetical protein
MHHLIIKLILGTITSLPLNRAIIAEGKENKGHFSFSKLPLVAAA